MIMDNILYFTVHKVGYVLMKALFPNEKKNVGILSFFVTVSGNIKTDCKIHSEFQQVITIAE